MLKRLWSLWKLSKMIEVTEDGSLFVCIKKDYRINTGGNIYQNCDADFNGEETEDVEEVEQGLMSQVYDRLRFPAEVVLKKETKCQCST